jgi:two-component system NtrC family sensor kinase
MIIRQSLRNKLVYTFVAGSLLTVLLFSVVIKGIMNDYFDRLSAVRREFVQEQGRRDIQTNIGLFKDSFQDIFGEITSAVAVLSQTGVIGDRLPGTQAERLRLAEALRETQREAELSMITVVDLRGRTLLRSTNPDAHGDDVLLRDYDDPEKPVSAVARLITDAISGETIQAFATFAPEILASENLNKQAAVRLKSNVTTTVAPNTFEERGLMLTVAMPVRTSSGKIVGAVLAARLLNNDLSIVEGFQNLLNDYASIIMSDIRVATTTIIGVGESKGENATGTVLNEQVSRIVSRGGLTSRTVSIAGEPTMTTYEPLLDHDKKIIGAISVGRPLSFIDSINRSQEAIEAEAGRRSNLYIVGSAIISLLLAVGIAWFFSKRVTARIDQLRKGAEVIQKGRLDYRLQIDSGDEIEQLSKQFNSMASKLEESHQTLERKVEERTRELKESQEAMVQQEKMVGIGQLAAGIAHELNTPLGTIIGYAQMLREDLSHRPSSASLSDVDEIIEEAGRCRDLVKNLLNFSRRPTIDRAERDVNEIILRIVSFVAHDFEMRGVHVHTDLDRNLPHTRVNENEIAQVILNLANNAADSMPEGGDLYISTGFNEDTDQLRITIHDTGCGIKESDRNRVFEPFFTTKEVGKGTGLGLSICYKIIENHMGSIEFDTVTGEGTTFRVHLPVDAKVAIG